MSYPRNHADNSAQSGTDNYRKIWNDYYKVYYNHSRNSDEGYAKWSQNLPSNSQGVGSWGPPPDAPPHLHPPPPFARQRPPGAWSGEDRGQPQRYPPNRRCNRDDWESPVPAKRLHMENYDDYGGGSSFPPSRFGPPTYGSMDQYGPRFSNPAFAPPRLSRFCGGAGDDFHAPMRHRFPSEPMMGGNFWDHRESRQSRGKSSRRDKSVSSAVPRLLGGVYKPPKESQGSKNRQRDIEKWCEAATREYNKLDKSDPSLRRKLVSILSDTLQRELHKYMVFVYGFVKEIPQTDRGYYKNVSDDKLICDVVLDDIFLMQSLADERTESREIAAEKIMELFLLPKLKVMPAYRRWSGESIPVYCVVAEGSRTPTALPPFPRNPRRECGSKSLPWLQAHPADRERVKKRTTRRLKPKLLGDIFLNVADEKHLSVHILNSTGQFNQMKIEYRNEPIGSQSKCSIILDDQLVGDGVGRDFQSAKRSAADSVYKKLRATQPVVRLMPGRARKVTRDDIADYAAKLEARGDKLDESVERHPMCEPELAKIETDAEAYLYDYVHDPANDTPLTFTGFTHDERMAIHKAARRHDLASKTWKLVHSVSKRYSVLQAKKMLLRTGSSGRYELVEKGTVDLSHLLDLVEEETEDEDEEETLEGEEEK